MHDTIDLICLLGVDGSIMIADGKVAPCFHWFLEAYATLEGLLFFSLPPVCLACRVWEGGLLCYWFLFFFCILYCKTPDN